MIRIFLGLWMVALLAGSLHAEDFTDALNQQRSARGLRAVEHDPGLDKVAAANNAQQAARGQGHWFTGGYGQCCYVGPLTKLGALFGHAFGIGYLQSSSHAGLLLHPFAIRIGIDQTENRNTVVIAFDDKPKNQVESKPAAVTATPQGANSGTSKNGMPAACSTQATPQTGCEGVVANPIRFRRGLFGWLRCRGK